MFFKSLFAQKTANEDEKSAETEMRHAVAALFVEAARADEAYEDHEKEIIDKALAGLFGVSTEAAADLRASGETAQAEALDIQRFTRLAKSMAHEEKIEFIERLWEVVLSDGERDPFEDALIRRICGLIYVDDKDSGAARARIAKRLNLS
ncbi:MAG: TerB family tellurite resistance protein [Pseudomonadota bacterium]